MLEMFSCMSFLIVRRRIERSSTLIELKQRQNCKKFPNFQILIIPVHSKLPVAQLVVDSWICPAFILCANTAITNGMPNIYVMSFLMFFIHRRCLADHETECPNCARSHGVIREIRRNNERLADQVWSLLPYFSEKILLRNLHSARPFPRGCI